MSEFDRVVREREKADAAAAYASNAAKANADRAVRAKTWNEAVAAATAALEGLGRVDPADWPPAKTLHLQRKTLFGGYKRYSIAGFALTSYRYLGKGQTSATLEHHKWEATVYLLSDGRLALELGGAVNPLDEHLDWILDGKGDWRHLPLETVRDRLRALAAR
jgi:hypothetical protein